MSQEDHKLPAYAFCTPEQATRYANLVKEGRWALLPSEEAWRNRQPFLEAHGYLLRTRYNTNWTPSWVGTLRDPAFCEDSHMSKHAHIIDATRASDSKFVAIKVVSKDTEEVGIARFLCSPRLLRDPTNHCAPILDVLPDPTDGTKALIVMQYLRPFDDPDFEYIGEAVDFISQTLEGLVFMHVQGVAHRDCASANIMMDATPLYPEGHHPLLLRYAPDGITDAPALSRIDHPVRYHFIDFGLSTRLKAGQSQYVLGTKGRDKDPPELSNQVPYDAFKLDIFVLGHVYQKAFLSRYYGLEVLEPLVSSMMDTDPTCRPTAQQALDKFEDIRAGLDGAMLRWRLRSKSESVPARMVYDTVAAAREGIYQFKRLVF